MEKNKKNVEERKRTLDVSSLLARDGFFWRVEIRKIVSDVQNRFCVD